MSSGLGMGKAKWEPLVSFLRAEAGLAIVLRVGRGAHLGAESFTAEDRCSRQRSREGLGGAYSNVTQGNHVKEVGCAKWAGLCHVAWGEVGGDLDSVRDVGGGGAGGGGHRLWGSELWVLLYGSDLSPCCSTPSSLGASPALALPCRR